MKQIIELLKDLDSTLVNLHLEGREWAANKRVKVLDAIKELEQLEVLHVPYVKEDKRKMYFSTFICELSDEEQGIKGDICHIGQSLIVNLNKTQFKIDLMPVVESLALKLKEIPA